MKRPHWALASILILGIAACAGAKQSVRVNVDRSDGTVKYPIVIHVQDGGTSCDVVEWTRERVHLKHGWKVNFQVRNTCNDAQELGIVDQDGEDKVFDGKSPYTVSVPGNSTRVLTLVVSANAKVGQHKSDLAFHGRKLDPDWEIEP